MGSSSFLSFMYGSIPALSATMALLYALSASVFLAAWKEASLSSLLMGPTCLRALTLWIVAIGVAVHRWRSSSELLSSTAGTHVEDNEIGLLLILDLATSVGFAVASWWLLRQVRTNLVEGGPPPPRPSAFLVDENRDADMSNNVSSNSGKVVVITGCNQGIGKETLRLLFSSTRTSPSNLPSSPSESSKQANGRGSNKIGAARMPRHTVILCCRSVDKARQAAVDVGLLVPQDLGGDATTTAAAAAGTSTNGDRQQHTDRNGAANATTYTSALRVNVELVELDLSDLAQVRTAAKRIVDLNPTIHVLVNNAGLMMDRQQFANQKQQQHGDDGDSKPSSPSSSSPYELVMTANHLGHFLLTRLLRPTECVVNVSSCTYALSDPHFLDDIFCTNGTRKYTMFGQYAASKAANLLFTAELRRRVVQEGHRRRTRPSKRLSQQSNASEEEDKEPCWKYPMCHAVHPGMVRTNVVRNMPWYLRIPNDLLGFLVSPFQKTPEQGAWNTVHAINETYRNPPPNEKVTSSPSWTYWVNRKPSDVLPWIHNEDTARRLWERSSDLVQLPHDYYYDSNEHQDDSKDINEQRLVNHPGARPETVRAIRNDDMTTSIDSSSRLPTAVLFTG